MDFRNAVKEENWTDLKPLQIKWEMALKKVCIDLYINVFKLDCESTLHLGARQWHSLALYIRYYIIYYITYYIILYVNYMILKKVCESAYESSSVVFLCDDACV